jgi:hypothetical protein
MRRACVAALLLVSLAAPARAMDKAACAAAAVSGQELTRAHKLVEARTKLVQCSSPDCPEIIERDCADWLREVVARVPTLAVETSAGATIEIDGVPVTSAGAVAVDPGSRRVSVHRDGYVSTERIVMVAEAEHKTVTIALSPIVAALPVVVAKPPPSSRTPWLVAAIGTSAVALTGFALFAGFGASGLSDQNALRTSCAPYCTSSQVDPVSTQFTTANVGLVIGVVGLLVASAAWFFTARR